MKSKRTGLTLGLLAGAAIAAYAVNKLSKNSFKKLGERTAELRNKLTDELIELKNIKRTEQRFI